MEYLGVLDHSSFLGTQALPHAECQSVDLQRLVIRGLPQPAAFDKRVDDRTRSIEVRRPRVEKDTSVQFELRQKHPQ